MHFFLVVANRHCSPSLPWHMTATSLRGSCPTASFLHLENDACITSRTVFKYGRVYKKGPERRWK